MICSIGVGVGRAHVQQLQTNTFDDSIRMNIFCCVEEGMYLLRIDV